MAAAHRGVTMVEQRGCGTGRQATRLLILEGHTDAVMSASFLAQMGCGRLPRVMTGQRGCGTRRQGALVLTLRGHSGSGWSASFSPDGLRILTTSGFQATVWDAKTGGYAP